LKASQEASSSKRRRTSTKTSHPLEATLQTYRTSLDAIKQQRKLPKLERAMQLSTTYHQMALIHHQLGRYQTALHVLDHAVEVLIQAAANAAAVAGAFHPSRHNDDDISDDTRDPSHLPLLNETIPFLSSKSLLLVATMFTVQAKAYIAQGLHDTAKDRVEQVMICLGNERARRRIGHPVPYVNGGAHSVTTEWSLTMARAQVVLGQCYQQQRCPDVAMRCFQDALHIQRHLLGDWHVQVVDTVKCIGDLHLSQCVLGHAFGCYQEALRVYRHLMATEQYRRHDFHSLSCLRADTSTLLTSLGWISLLQHDLHSAWDMSLEAHQLAMQSNGLCHRNMASIRYQLGWIQWWSSPSVPDSPRIVLSQWKWVLKHQEQALNRGSLEEENHHRYNVEDGKYFSIHRHPHVDLAKTLHAIGHAYHAIGHSGKSCCAIQAAEEIYRVNLPQALQRYDQKQ
jgi:tetratricopeptide (TPR) repeat protein